MTEDDKTRFAQIMAGMAGALGAQLSSAGLKILFEVLKEFSIEQIEAACIACLKSRKYTSMPTPGELIEFINGGSVEDQGMVAATAVWNALREHGSYRTIMFDDPVLMHTIERDPTNLSRPCVENDGAIPTPAIVMRLLDAAETLDNGPPGSLSCAGLAANQIGINARVNVVKISGRFKAFVNPVILGRFGAKYTAIEGCFSFPGQQRAALRFPEIMVKAQGMTAPKKIRGREAQAFQHEVDHLNGVLI